jgi:hypothetical protein
MKRLTLNAILACVALAAWGLCAPAQDMPQQRKAPRRTGQMPQERMEVVARRLNLGARRADSESPRATQSGYGDKAVGYYQCFERGCVYYGAGTGVHAVAGAIFTKYVADGYERGALGFPVSDEQTCARPADARYQVFEGGRIVFDGATGQSTTYADRSAAADAGDCRGASATSPAPPAGSSAGAARTGRFRVTLNGFTVNRQTFDHALDADGKSDEIFFLNKVALYRKDAQGGVSVRFMPILDSRIMGDVNGHSGRVRAGSAGDQGGLRTGDRFPSQEPWVRGAAPGVDTLPMLLWEGELTKGEAWVKIVPTIWEWDNGDRHLRATWDSNSEHWLASPHDPEATLPPTPLVYPLSLLGGGGAARNAAWHAFGTAEDRPVGMRKDRRGAELFDPTWLVLTFENATRAVSEAQGTKGVGIVEIPYTDSDEFNGHYTLYVQVERLP